jgi:hypothetical protein
MVDAMSVFSLARAYAASFFAFSAASSIEPTM